jgi:UDPglucose 6-dehydrogenase
VKLDSDAFPDMRRCTSALEAVEDADVTVIMTPWKEFAEAPLAEVKRKMRGRSIVDPFGALNKDICCQLGFDYYRLGVDNR